MSKRKLNLNTIYISERVQETLRLISHCALTTVVAPMGYGKTTAINWHLADRIRAEQATTIRISIYSDNLSIFWKSVQNAFSYAGLAFLNDCSLPSDAPAAGLLADNICHSLNGQTQYYIFMDDFHQLTDTSVAIFLCALADRLPDNVHIITASRDRFLQGSEIVRLGSRLHQIGVEHLRLNHTELAAYAHHCGMNLSDEQIGSLLNSSEGWFSAIYLHLCSLAERGYLPDSNSDIYDIFSAAMIEPLPVSRQEFLAVMGLADEFSVEMAQFITGNKEAARIISSLTEHNAFVTRLPDSRVFRFHHMMKECAERAFAMIDRDKSDLYLNQFGTWYEAHNQYIHALNSYQKAGNYQAVLQVILKDAGVLLAALKPAEVLKILESCPRELLKNNPPAILVLMRRMFTWRMIPKMLELKDLLTESIEQRPEMSDEERGNLLGECDLIMSFLMYNDITMMSRLHRSASRQMSRPAISINKKGSWTFGSPSVLMMFHRTHGALNRELEEMNDCMPHYYKLTNGHGQGAELVMSAEAAFMQGRLNDARILLEQARVRISENRLENIALCCDALQYRLSLCSDSDPEEDVGKRYNELVNKHDMMHINIYDSICAYYYALLQQTDKIPSIFANHTLSTVNYLAPCKPMMEMIENQVYLAQGEYAKVIGRSEALLALCNSMNYALVSLHIKLQTASAYEMLGKRADARRLVEQSILEAKPDGLLIPYVENYCYLNKLLQELPNTDSADFIDSIISLGHVYRARCKELVRTNARPEIYTLLTDREIEITELIAGHLSNKEIAAKMYLSEGTVKQYVNQIYSKLHIIGDTRTKRKQLINHINSKN